MFSFVVDSFRVFSLLNFSLPRRPTSLATSMLRGSGLYAGLGEFRWHGREVSLGERLRVDRPDRSLVARSTTGERAAIRMLDSFTIFRATEPIRPNPLGADGL